MLLDVARDRDSSSDEPASNSRRTDRSGSDPASGVDGAGDARGEYEGCRDVESLTPLHQILPYRSQFRDTSSSAGHAWVDADIRDDDQVKDAVAPRERRHDITRVPAPWGLAPQQDALRGVITSYDSDGRCSYAATHKCHSSHSHLSRCLVVDHPGDAEFWGDVTEECTSTHERKSLVGLVRCERCAVGIHPAYAVGYSEWSGKVGSRGGTSTDVASSGGACSS